jgi:quinol-cytochrome oxidoreductase complex cytochrome b subunit
LIAVVVLHMVQVFLYGAYKKPREATWMVGVVLLLVTLAYGLTGYLLPWDNRAYWGTVVTTRIAASAPLVGPYLTRLLGVGGGGVGVVTFRAILRHARAAVAASHHSADRTARLPGPQTRGGPRTGR